MKAGNTDFLGVLKWNEIRDYQLLQVIFTLATLSSNRYTIFKTNYRINLCKHNKVDQCHNEKSALQMWLNSVVSVKVLQCLGWEILNY